MSGRPNFRVLICPKCEQYDTFRAVYARQGNRYIKLGRQCIDLNVMNYRGYVVKPKKGCGHTVFDTVIETPE